ncbi:unnamed protein product [Lactuca saligna]|uniref:Uncharacterized protein n=1 Tax=Lactuca saligna TaxID=75948 RepID=A0AA35ZEY8_LACSI|nr:unnamed protein product [Lactuca saligna]
MESKGNKRLNKEMFSHILHLPSNGSFEVPMYEQETKKRKAIGVLKCFKKLRFLTVEEPSTIALPKPNTFEVNHDSEETEDVFLGNDDLIFHVLTRKDATIESNIKET